MMKRLNPSLSQERISRLGSHELGESRCCLRRQKLMNTFHYILITGLGASIAWLGKHDWLSTRLEIQIGKG